MGYAQESIGIGISNYSPTNSLYLNPSSIVDSRAFLDIHLVGASVFGMNDVVYLPAGVRLMQPSSFEGVQPNYDLSRPPFSAYVDALVQGPSASLQIGKHALALTTGVRSVTDVRNVGSKLTTYIQNGFNYGEYIGTNTRIQDLAITSLSWAEVGLTYGTIVKQQGRDMVTAGGSVRKLFGIAGTGVRLNEWLFTVPDSGRLVTETLSGRYALSEIGWNTGGGFGVDLGVTFKKTNQDVSGYTPFSRASGCKQSDYKYKVSIALLDIGFVNFKGDFLADQFDETTTGYEWTNFDSTQVDGVEDIGSFISDNLPVLNANKEPSMRVWLPMGLSTQVDYQVLQYFYMNGSLVLGVPFRNALGVQRAASLAITPRYERKRFEAALPVSFFEIKKPMIGAMFRLNSVVIGTDNLGSLFFNGEKYGADIYFHLKYTIFRSRQCKGIRVGAGGRGGGRTIGCPTW
ncbi:MAG: hypothetical protein RL226_604 [Bacteroidota bacterium]